MLNSKRLESPKSASNASLDGLEKVKLSPSLYHETPPDEFASDPAFDALRKVKAAFLARRKPIPFEKKFLTNQKRLLGQKMLHVLASDPDLALKDALAQLLVDIPVSVPPKMLLDITRHLVELWEEHFEDAAVLA